MNEKFSFAKHKSPLIHDDYFNRIFEREFLIEFSEKIVSKFRYGDWYTIRLEKRVEPSIMTAFDSPISSEEVHYMDVYVGKPTISEVSIKTKTLSLSWRERLRAFFTGKVQYLSYE